MCLIAPSCNAQYQKLLRGQPSPFDTAVAVRIDRYRVEGLKIKLADHLIDSLLLEIKGLHREVFLGDSAARIQTLQVHLLTTATIRKDSVITWQAGAIHTMANAPPAPKFELKTFIKKPENIGLLVLLVIEGIRLISGQ